MVMEYVEGGDCATLLKVSYCLIEVIFESDKSERHYIIFTFDRIWARCHLIWQGFTSLKLS